MKARGTGTPDSDLALAQLCELYWPPLYSYARRLGHSAEDAQDLTQAFFTRFLEKQFVEAANPTRGRFRSFLLACFKHFMANERDRESAQKRGGGRPPVALAFDAAEAQYEAEPATALTPEALYEKQWARGVIDRVMATLGVECADAGKEKVFTHVKDLLVGEKSDAGYRSLAEALGTTEGALKVTIHRLRARFRHLLRAEIAATVSDDAAIDDELRHLMAVLAG
jgi:RNA polymerase sigma factor (sigma-70 family)